MIVPLTVMREMKPQRLIAPVGTEGESAREREYRLRAEELALRVLNGCSVVALVGNLICG